VRVVSGAEPGEGRDGGCLGTEGGRQAGMDRNAVEEDGAGAAIAAVAAALDGEMSMLAQQRAQALARAGLGPDRLAVDDERDQEASSDASSSARRAVM
jgi:hydroxymethylglutaryl-CoA reductase